MQTIDRKVDDNMARFTIKLAAPKREAKVAITTYNYTLTK